MDGSKESFGKADLIYKGDVAKWKTLANSVKLKLGLHLADIEPAKAKAIVESAYNSGVMTSEDQTALFQYFSSLVDMNPLYDTLVNESQTIPTEYFVNQLNGKNDPRRDIFFNPNSKKQGNYKGAPYAKQVSYGDFSNMGSRLK
jgi:hypothetical protein